MTCENKRNLRKHDITSNSIKRGDWLLNVPLDSGHLVKLVEFY